MKKLLLPLLAAGVCASASAVTVDDLVGKTVAVMLNGNDFQLSLPVATSAGSFTKTKENSKTVHLNNFYEGFGSNFELRGDKLVFKAYTGDNGSQIYSSNVYGVFSKCKSHQYQATMDGEQAVVMCWEAGSTNEDWISNTYAGDPAGVQGWAFNNADGESLLLELVDVTNGTQNPNVINIQCFNGMQVYTYPTNATATEYQGNLIGDMYNVNVEIKDGNITIKNFLNQGMSFQNNPETLKYTLGFVHGTIDAEGNIELPIQEIAGDVDFSFTGSGEADDSLLGNGLLFENGPEGYWFIYLGTTYYPWQLVDYSTFDKATGSAAPVTGKLLAGEASHSGKNRWVGHDGDCKTNVKTIIDLGPAGVYGSYYNDIIGSADRTVIESSQEMTAGVELRIAKGSYWDKYANVMGFITSKENTDNVAYYDVYAIPGHYESLNDAGFDVDNELGHKKAILVYDGSKESEKDYTFSGSFAHAAQSTGDYEYTYFVKANYKPESGLEPTFHALTPYSMTNSAAEIEATDAARVTAANGVITIAGTDAEATVYNAAGAVVYQGLDREIAVENGVYVVRLGATVVKVVL